ncbi:TlpA family protein disulfide reductase [Bacteroides nordii]|uniref:TlpA family protein disulfide reductase n=1 Tax=Bacteroides nordii TaxID=291645 RepID=UPI0020406FD8|nr:TlpA disulfide reductase family protein [Bacteroides nordii]GFZ38470.1 thiol:disulfide interchange protein [Bacteroides nordii]
MKQLVLIVCFLLNVAYTQAQERMIEQPPFSNWSSTSIEVDKVALSDTATVLHIKAFYRPKNWIKIASGSFLKGSDGELYPLRHGIGITPDQKFWMPESGQAEFKLVFPPLPKDITSIDFSEGDTEGAFKIWGIQLDGKLPKLKLPAEATERTKKLTTLPTPKIEKGKALLEGQILDFEPGMSSNFTIYLRGAINLEQKVDIKVNDNGQFSSEIPVITTTPATLYTGIEAIDFLLAPGEKTNLFINQREICRRQSKLHKDKKSNEANVYYGGYLAGPSGEIAKLNFKTNIDDDYPQFIKDLKDKNAEEVKAYILNKHKEKLRQIDALKATKACKEMLCCAVDASAASLLTFVPGIMQRVHITNYKLKDEQVNEYIKNNPVNLPDDFLNVLRDFPSLNTTQAMYVPLYMRLTGSPMFRTAFSKALGTDKGIYFELSTVADVLNGINDFTPVTEEQLAKISALSTPVYLEAVKEKNDELLAKIEENKKKTGFTINEAGVVSNEDLFASIISKYRGHTLLVDFWATWCGPCRMANKAMIPMKEELKDRDIVYIYLTGETSPKGTWENMIPDIHGEHFRVTADQWSYLMNSFQIRGVPTYLLVDREGNITYKTTGFPGVDKMKSELLKVLNK